MQNEEIEIEKSNHQKALFWFRNDLRIEDNFSLYKALSKYDNVACVYVFDKDFIKSLRKKDYTMEFLYRAISSLKKELRSHGSDLIIRVGNPVDEIPKIAKQYGANAIVSSKIFLHKETIKEDIIEKKLYYDDIAFESYKDNVIFSPEDLLDKDGEYFNDFTRYREMWKKFIKTEDIKPVFIDNKNKLAKFKSNDLPKLEQFGFIGSILPEKMEVSEQAALNQFFKFRTKMKRYMKTKDIVHYAGVSYMSIYLRFGLISIRTMLSYVSLTMKEANDEEKEHMKSWIDQLIRREFYIQYYYYNYHLFKEPEKRHYMKMQWDNNMEFFNKWCEGKTGYPLIDAAMKSMQKTGYMHHRLRQITATFLVKTLFIDYKYGEAFFATTLLDYDPILNNVGWQWAASVDKSSVEYVRMYDPSENSKLFDSNAQFIKKYLPELANVPSKYLHAPWLYEKELKALGVTLGKDYPHPIVLYKDRRDYVLKKYEEINKL